LSKEKTAGYWSLVSVFLYQTSPKLRRVGHRADHFQAGTLARPTNSRSFFFDQTGRFCGQRLR
jgi:hypothetical protein